MYVTLMYGNVNTKVCKSYTYYKYTFNYIKSARFLFYVTSKFVYTL